MIKTAARWVLECTTAGQDPISVRLPPGEYILGREPTCHVILQGKQVSRRHALLRVGTGTHVTLEDLGSFNGTLVAGNRIQRALLHGGEDVAVGEWAVRLRPAAVTDSTVAAVSEPPAQVANAFDDQTTASVAAALRVDALVASRQAGPEARAPLTPQHTPAAAISLIMPALQVHWKSSPGTEGETTRERAVGESALLKKLTLHATPLQGITIAQEVAELATLARQQRDPQELALRLVYRVAGELQGAKGEEDFLNAMAETIMLAIRAQTVALLMCPPGPVDATTIVPRVVRTSGAAVPQRFSRSVVDQALRRRVAVTTEDASADARFAKNISVVDLDLKAVLAVPMLRDTAPVGVIYVTRKVPFQEWEEDLVAALGHLTALGIERAQLKERVAEEEALRHTLERFHTREVVEKLMQKQAQEGQGGLFLEPINATVMFTDLSGFTSYCDRHTTTEVAELLNGYLGEMTRVVYEFRGTVDKYIGDAVMAVFGAPFPAADDALRAARCALAMQEAFAALMAGRPEGERLALRIGLNSGPLLAGTVGSPLRLEYTCLGDTVNVAQRLEGIAPPGGILLGPLTAQAVMGRLKVAARGAKSLKGKADAVEVFELQA
ncbi:MAG: FHA domain-containing protein [Deltaproteobacteria bacterium]|nr:FHA domain-containing protein [Deltaproteobacteria bacterium]